MPAVIKGVYLSLVTMFLWATHDVLFRFAAVNYHVEPTVFICLTLFEAAIVLIIIGGPGKGGINTLRQIHTWGYGVLEILLNISQMFALIYITSTEMNFLNRATIIMSLLATWLFFKRTPSKHDAIGGIAVTVGLVYIAYNIAPEVRLISLFCLFWVALTSTACAMIGEVHPENNKAVTIREKCRVSGYVLLVCSLLFLIFSFGMAAIKLSLDSSNLVEVAFLNFLPSMQDFMHKPTVIIALLMGLTVMPAAMYYFFYATKTAKTETFMMISSFLPFMTYAIERIFSNFGLLDVSNINSGHFIAGGIIVAGAMYMIYMKHLHEHIPVIKAKRKKAKKDEQEKGISDYDMLCETLEFCDNNNEEASKLLGISVSEVTAVYEAEGARKFKETKDLDIGRNYHRNVASCDALTRLSKREVLIKAMNGSIKLNQPFTVMFIDLDKFKPVNDTYGHEAGNEVLQAVADVLNVSTPKNSIVARVGGDEFVIMLRKSSAKQVTDLKKSIKQRLGTKFQVPAAFEAVQIGSSIGIASFPKDGKTAADLIKLADSKMYEDKDDSR